MDWMEGYCCVSLIGVALVGVIWEVIVGGVVILRGGVEGGVVRAVDTLRGGVEGGSTLLLDGPLTDCEDFLAVSFSNRFASSGKGHTVGVELALIENLLEGTNGSLEAHL